MTFPAVKSDGQLSAGGNPSMFSLFKELGFLISYQELLNLKKYGYEYRYPPNPEPVLQLKPISVNKNIFLKKSIWEG